MATSSASAMIRGAAHHSSFVPSFPIHGKAFLLVFDSNLLTQFENTAEKLSERGAIDISCMEPSHFLERLGAVGAATVDGFDLVLISIPTVDDKESTMEDGLPFSGHVAKQLYRAKVSIPCVALTRADADGNDPLGLVADGSFRLVLHTPLDVDKLESLISHEELFSNHEVDFDAATATAKKAAEASGSTRTGSDVQRKERERLLTRAAEMHRLHESSVSQVAGLVQWAAVEGITVPATPHPEALPYWQQGDTSWYTPDMLRKRLQLRHDPDVVHCIREFWAALEPMRSPTPKPLDPLKPPPDKGLVRRYLPENGYKVFHKCLQHIVMPAEEYDARLAEVTAHTDWLRDSDEKGLTYPGFFESLFEMTDLWCQDVDGGAYVAFLRDLQQKIARNQSSSDSAESFCGVRWRPVFEAAEEPGADELPLEVETYTLAVPAPQEIAAVEQEPDPKPVVRSAPVTESDHQLPVIEIDEEQEVDDGGLWETYEEPTSEEDDEHDPNSESGSEEESAPTGNDVSLQSTLSDGGKKPQMPRIRLGGGGGHKRKPARSDANRGSESEIFSPSGSGGASSGEAMTNALNSAVSNGDREDEECDDSNASSAVGKFNKRRKPKRSKTRRANARTMVADPGQGLSHDVKPLGEEASTTLKTVEDKAKAIAQEQSESADQQNGESNDGSDDGTSVVNFANRDAPDPVQNRHASSPLSASEALQQEGGAVEKVQGQPQRHRQHEHDGISTTGVQHPGSSQDEGPSTLNGQGSSPQQRRTSRTATPLSRSSSSRGSPTSKWEMDQANLDQKHLAQILHDKAEGTAAAQEAVKKRIVSGAQRSLSELELIETVKAAAALHNSSDGPDLESVAELNEDKQATASGGRGLTLLARTASLMDMDAQEQELVAQLRPGLEKLSLKKQKEVLQGLLDDLYRATSLDDMSAPQRALVLKFHPQLADMTSEQQRETLHVLRARSKVRSQDTLESLDAGARAAALRLYPELAKLSPEQQRPILQALRQSLYSFESLGDMDEDRRALALQLHPDLAHMTPAEQRELLQQLLRACLGGGSSRGGKPAFGHGGSWHGGGAGFRRGDNSAASASRQGTASSADAKGEARRASLFAELSNGVGLNGGGSDKTHHGAIHSGDLLIGPPIVYTHNPTHTQRFRHLALSEMTDEERREVLTAYPQLDSMTPEQQKAAMLYLMQQQEKYLDNIVAPTSENTPQGRTRTDSGSAPRTYTSNHVQSRPRNATLKTTRIDLDLDDDEVARGRLTPSPTFDGVLPGKMLHRDEMTGVAVVTRVAPAASMVRFGAIAALVALTRRRSAIARDNAVALAAAEAAAAQRERAQSKKKSKQSNNWKARERRTTNPDNFREMPFNLHAKFTDTAPALPREPDKFRKPTANTSTGFATGSVSKAAPPRETTRGADVAVTKRCARDEKSDSVLHNVFPIFGEVTPWNTGQFGGIELPPKEAAAIAAAQKTIEKEAREAARAKKREERARQKQRKQALEAAAEEKYHRRDIMSLVAAETDGDDVPSANAAATSGVPLSTVVARRGPARASGQDLHPAEDLHKRPAGLLATGTTTGNSATSIAVAGAELGGISGAGMPHKKRLQLKAVTRRASTPSKTNLEPPSEFKEPSSGFRPHVLSRAVRTPLGIKTGPDKSAATKRAPGSDDASMHVVSGQALLHGALSLNSTGRFGAVDFKSGVTSRSRSTSPTWQHEQTRKQQEIAQRRLEGTLGGQPQSATGRVRKLRRWKWGQWIEESVVDEVIFSKSRPADLDCAATAARATSLDSRNLSRPTSAGVGRSDEAAAWTQIPAPELNQRVSPSGASLFNQAHVSPSRALYLDSSSRRPMSYNHHPRSRSPSPSRSRSPSPLPLPLTESASRRGPVLKPLRNNAHHWSDGPEGAAILPTAEFHLPRLARAATPDSVVQRGTAIGGTGLGVRNGDPGSINTQRQSATCHPTSERKPPGVDLGKFGRGPSNYGSAATTNPVASYRNPFARERRVPDSASALSNKTGRSGRSLPGLGRGTGSVARLGSY